MSSETFEVRDRRSGFLWITNSFFDSYAPLLQSSSFMVYVALCRLANNQTQQCFPSYEKIASMVGLSRSVVATALNDLRERGLIGWEKSGRSNSYYLLDVTSPDSGRIENTHQSELGPEPVRPTGLLKSGPPDPNKTLGNKTKEQDSISPLTRSDESEFVLSGEPKISDSSQKEKQVDPRTATVRDMLKKFWNSLNSPDELYWDGGDATQLKAFLKRWPKKTPREIAEALVHYRDSEKIIETATPKEFLPRLHRYFNGPLNEFNKPMEVNRASA